MRRALASFLLALPLLTAAQTRVREAEGITEYRLANGLQVLLIPDASKPAITVNLTYRVGSRHEGGGETGMAHLLEHLMFKTSRRFANVANELSRRGMQFNGTTSLDRTNYYETFPADPEQLAWVLRLEADRMTGARILRSDLDSEMTVVRNEMEAGENNALGILQQLAQAAAYQWHPYGRATIGARSDVEHVGIPRLRAFYQRHYQPDNATLTVAGAFDPAATLRDIQARFGALPRPTRRLEPSYTVEPVQEGEREVTLRRISGQQGVVAAYHVPTLAAPEFAAFEVAATALADTPTGRLHRRLVEPGLAAEVQAQSAYGAEPGLLNFVAVLGPQASVEQAQAVLIETIEGVGREPITAEELKRAKRQWIKQFDELMANPQNLCVTLSDAIGAGDWRLFFALRDRVEAVTLEQVNATLQAWLLPSNRTLARLFATEAPQRSPLAQALPAEAALRDFKPRPGLAAGEAFDTSPAHFDRRTERYHLPGGLQVALVPKRSRGEVVELVLNLHWGSLASLRGWRAEAAALGGLLPLGTAGHSRAELADAFDELRTRWAVTSDPLTGLSASLSSRRGQLGAALALLTEVLRQPAFPPDELAQAVRVKVAALEAAAGEPQAMVGLNLQRALHAGVPADDPRYQPAIPEEIAAVQALSRERVLEFYRRHVGLAQAELAIVGDFDPAEIKPLIERLVADWPAATPYARVPQPGWKAEGQVLTASFKDKANAAVLAVLPLALQDDHPDFASLRLAVQVLGAGGFDSRLMARLRGQDGLSYGVSASFAASSFEPNGEIEISAIFAPENRAKVEKALREELTRLVRDGVTARELQHAKRALRAEGQQWRSDDAAVAAAIAGQLERGRRFQWSGDLADAIQARSVAEVNAALRRWVDPAKFSWSWAGSFD